MINFFNNLTLVGFFLKSFAIVFSVIYLLYAIVILQQVQVMNRIVRSNGGSILWMIALFQIIMAIFLVILAIVFI